MSLIESAGGLLEQAWTALRARASSAKMVGSDIGRYAIRRIRGREADPLDVLHESLSRIIVMAADQLIEAKKATAVCIADCNRLVKMIEQEQSSAAEWQKRAAVAVQAGAPALAHEARGRAAQHEALVERLRSQWRKAEEGVRETRQELREIHIAFEDAKRAMNRLHTARAAAAAREQLRAVRDTVHALEAILGELEGWEPERAPEGSEAPSGGGLPN